MPLMTPSKSAIGAPICSPSRWLRRNSRIVRSFGAVRLLTTVTAERTAPSASKNLNIIVASAR